MNPNWLLKHFDQISEAPDSVPRLRWFFLDLAVRGKLVEQDPNDEPASILLKRIKNEKKRQEKDGTIRIQKSMVPMNESEHLYSLPISWNWIRLSEVGAIIGGGTPPSKDDSCFTDGGAGFAWLTPADLGKHDDLFISHGARDLTERGLACSSAQLMPKGTVLFTSRAPIGYTAIAANKISTNQGFKSVVPFILELNRYIVIYFKAFAEWIDGKASGTTFKEVSRKIVSNLPFPLPPIAEQHRIVAKVDELMALCDELEAAQAKREKRRDGLMAATLHGLNNGDTSSEADNVATFEENARFYFNHLPRLTTRPEHIQQLRQTILNLAVRGKLVQQDSNEKSADELLMRLQSATKIQLKKNSKTRKVKAPTHILPENLQFGTPQSWRWAKLGELSELITKGSSPKWQGIDYVSEGDGVLFITSENVGNYRLKKLDDLKYVDKRFNDIEPRSILKHNDILMTLVGASIGRTAIYDLHNGANINQAVALIRLIPEIQGINIEFLLHYLNSSYAIDSMLSSRVVTAQPNISLTDVREFSVPLPPYAEQQRIVTKVNELMALCGELESQITNTTATRQQLLEATLQDALSA